jgi:ketol-acid reductoisomerase
MAEGGSNGGGAQGAKPGPTRAAVIGYGPEAREQAVRMRSMGWDVDVVMRPGGMSWIRAVADGFRPVPASEAAARADIAAIHLPDAEQPAVWAYSLEPYLAPGALVVFARATALYSGAVDPDPRLDVVLVTADGLAGGRSAADDRDSVSCRVAVHRDASGHALERAMSYARAAFGSPRMGTTTLDAEVRSELSALVAKKGGLAALLAEWDRFLANPSHEPDQATLTYYERLRATVLSGQGPVTIRPPKSRTELTERPRFRASRKRGAA